MGPRDPYDQRQRRAGRAKGGVIKSLEIPTTEVPTAPTSGSGGVSESPRGEYTDVRGWRNTITRDLMDGWALGWPVSMCLARLAMPPAE